MQKLKLILIRLTVLAIHYVSSVCFELYHWLRGKPAPIAKPQKDLLYKSATDLAQDIRDKRVTSEEVVETFIERIAEVNPCLNALVQDLFDEAKQECKKVDAYIRSDNYDAEKTAQEKPFLGVPFTVKELFKVKGLSCTCGDVLRRNTTETEDSPTVAALRKAGAICLGVGNVPQMAMWWETTNTIYGRTNNPYDFRRSPGGSTGGDACLVTASASPFTVGTDIAGSIRIPAFYTGIHGHMITPGCSDPSGLYPEPFSKELGEHLTSGPMSRYAKDLRPIARLLITDKTALQSLDTKFNLSNLKIYYMENDANNVYTTPVDNDIAEQIQRVSYYFEVKYGIKSQKVNFTEFQRSLDLIIYYLRYRGKGDEKRMTELVYPGKSPNLIWEIIKSVLGLSNNSTHVPLICATELEELSPQQQQERKEMLQKLRAKMIYLLGSDGVFLYPPQPSVAPYHNQTFCRGFNHTYASIFNALRLPVTSCPTAITDSGLPVGVQVVTAPQNDGLGIRVAEEIEKAFGGWLCPSQVKLLD